MGLLYLYLFFPCNCFSQLLPLDLAIMVSIFIHKNIVMTDGRLLHFMKLDVLSDMNFTAGPLEDDANCYTELRYRVSFCS
jgi:hypothetical protein